MNLWLLFQDKHSFQNLTPDSTKVEALPTGPEFSADSLSQIYICFKTLSHNFRKLSLPPYFEKQKPGLEGWHLVHLLLIQRTWVRFPSSTFGS